MTSSINQRYGVEKKPYKQKQINRRYVQSQLDNYNPDQLTIKVEENSVCASRNLNLDLSDSNGILTSRIENLSIDRPSYKVKKSLIKKRKGTLKQTNMTILSNPVSRNINQSGPFNTDIRTSIDSTYVKESLEKGILPYMGQHSM